MTYNLSHPYLEIYTRLSAYLSALPSASAKIALQQLAKDLDLGFVPRLQVASLLLLGSLGKKSIEELFFCRLRELYAYSVMHIETIDLIKPYAPVIEMGAGNGYNAWLLKQAGLDIAAFDAFPVEEGKNWFFNTSFGFPSKNGKSWTQVSKGDHDTLKSFPEHSLLLCWPPRNSMAIDCLSAFKGKHLVLIAQKSICGTPVFYKSLIEGWSLIHSQKTNSWSQSHQEELWIYKRK